SRRGKSFDELSCGVGLLRRPASECGRLCYGDGAHGRGACPRRVPKVAYALPAGETARMKAQRRAVVEVCSRLGVIELNTTDAAVASMSIAFAQDHDATPLAALRVVEG